MSANKRQFIYLFIVNFSFFMGFNSMSLMPAYLNSMGAGRGFIGFFNTSPILLLVFFVILQLFRGQSFHKLKVLRAGFLFTAAGAAGMIVFRGNLGIMFVCFLLTGISYATAFTNLFSMMFDIVPSEKRRSYAALFGISGLMTSGLASLITQAIYNNIADFAIFFLPLVFTLTAFSFSTFLDENSFVMIEKESFRFSRFIKKEGIIRLVFQALGFGGGFGVFKTFIPLFTVERLGIVDISRFFGLFTVVGIVYRLVFARYMDNLSKRLILVAGYVLMGGAILALGWITERYQLYIIGGVYGLAHSFLFPTISSEFIRIGDENRAAYNNIFLAIFTGGVTLSASGLGLLADYLGLAVIPYAIAIVITAAAVSLFVPVKTKIVKENL